MIYLLKLNQYISIIPAAFSVHYYSNTLPQLYTRPSSKHTQKRLFPPSNYTMQNKYADILYASISTTSHLLDKNSNLF